MGHFWHYTIPGLEWDVHLNTLIMSWAAMLVILGAAYASTRKLQVVPSKGQVVAEGFFDFCRSITQSTAGKRGDGFLFFIGSMFLFILLANLMGQLPLRLIQIPEGELIASTGDINTTAALAIMTLIMYFGVGIKRKGLRYFKHYMSPDPWYVGLCFLPLNILEDITRPGSLLIRLYFNILVGEILAFMAMQMMPIALPMLVIFLELFVAFIQAYIFAILSSVYISLLSDDHH